MADTDYDALRVREGASPTPDGIEELITHRSRVSASSIDVDETEPLMLADAIFLDGSLAETPNLPGLAQQADEFTCSRCYLIAHRRLYARTLRGKPVCRDCG